MRSRRSPSPGTRLTGDVGSGDVLGLVLITPLLVALALVVVLVGRRVDVTASVRSAAAAGAQAAALERSAVAAEHSARVVAMRMLESAATCGQVRVEVDTEAFGPSGSVTVIAGCRVDVGGLEMVAEHGDWSVSSAVASVDPYRWVDR
jgi:hypothetical protein